MSSSEKISQTVRLPDGPGAAAMLAAGLGVFVLSVLSIAGDRSAAFKKLMIFYTPTGPLSGVTTLAVAAWLLAWVGLDLSWRRRNAARWAIPAALVLLTLGFLLMIPPVADLF